MTVFNKFAQYAITHKDENICNLFNNFVRSLSQEEQKFIGKNYMLTIKAGEMARKAPIQIQQTFK